MKEISSANMKVAFNEQEIADRITKLGRQITEDYKDKKLTVLIVLKGSFIFAADLLRAIDLPMMVEFIGLKSYGSNTTSSGVVQITLDVKHSLEGSDVLIIEDIVDTGLTLDYLRSNLSTRNPASIKIVSLLHKPSRVIKDVPIDYLGFTVANDFLVGYGLDHDGKYRNLPFVCVLPEEAYDSERRSK